MAADIPQAVTETRRNSPGKIIGDALKNKFAFVADREGEEGVRRVEERLREWGIELEADKLRDFNFYPEHTETLFLMAVQHTLEWNAEQYREMGHFAAKHSIIARLMMKYFVSVSRAAKKANTYWGKYRTAGTLVAESIREQDNEVTLRLSDFMGHPLLCRYLEGYFAQVTSYVVEGEAVSRETECPLEDTSTDVHRFLVSW